MNVIKRDGTVQEFNVEKALSSFDKLYINGLKQTPSDELREKLKATLEKKFVQKKHKDDEQISVEDVQDTIRDFLMKKDPEAAESFVIYRENRSNYREGNSKLARNIKTKLFAKNVVNQNANVDEHSFTGRIGEAASEVCKDYALKNAMSKMARKNHESNRIYQHDLDSFAVGSHNCLTYPMDDSLNANIITRQTDIRDARSINSAMQLVAVNFQLQSLQQFGGVSASHLDWTMVPFFRISFFKHYIKGLKYVAGWSDKKINKFTHQFNINYTNGKLEIMKPCDKKETKSSIFHSLFGHHKEEHEYVNQNPLFKYNKVKETSILNIIYKNNNAVYEYALQETLEELAQAVEGLFHNINSIQVRSSGQVVFGSINYGTCTLPEGQYVIDALLDGQLAGTGPDHRTSIFPCAIFQYDEKINGKPGTPNYYLFKKALYSCSKRIYPNFANCQWSVQSNGQRWDREQKQTALEFILNESEERYMKLFNWLKDNPDAAYNMALIADGHVPSVHVIGVDDWNNQRPFEIMSTMGCRTYNSYDINSDASFWKKQFDYIIDNGELPRWKMWSANQKDGRGNICPVTIIMPTLAMEVKQAGNEQHKSEEDIIKDFMNMLDFKIQQAHDMLIERFTLICSQPEDAAKFMWHNNTMYGYDGDSVSSAMKHGTLAIGQIGLAETLRILIGTDHTTERGMELAKKIEWLFNKRCAEYKKTEHLNFGVYYTPAESLCKTSLQKFREKYGVIEGISDHEFFTNSIHVPVYDKVDMFEKIDIESQLTGFSNAGCITYIELDSEVENNPDAMEELVVYAMEHDIPYFAINRNLSYCRKCGTKGDFQKCPTCGAEGKDLEQLARVTGYLSTDVSNMNYGKQCEVHDRIKHSGCKIFDANTDKIRFDV